MRRLSSLLLGALLPLALATAASPSVSAVEEPAAGAGAIASAIDRAREIEAAKGSDSPELADALVKLGLLYYQSGAPADAVPCFEQALGIREKLPGGAKLTATLANLGGLCWQTGDYSRARPHLERAVAMAREGGDEKQLAAALNAHGLLLHAIGDLDAARTTLASAVEVFERQGAAGHAAKGLSNLGLALQEAGDGAGARHAFSRALALAGDDSSLRAHRATCLNNLGWSHYQAGELDDARRLLDQALGLRQEALGAEHPDVAWTLANLGLVAEANADVRAALERHGQALRLRESGLGADHPLVAQSLGDVARCRFLEGDAAGALELAARAENLGREHARLTLRALPERQALHHIAARDNAARRTSSLDLLLALARGARDPAAAARAFEAIIQSRALVFDEVSTRRRLERLRGDPALGEAARELMAARERLANLRYRGVAGEPAAAYRVALERARRIAEELESRFAATSRAGTDVDPRRSADLAAVAAALPADGAMVAYVRHDLVAVRASEMHYSAFVLANGQPPQAVALGRAAEIEAAAARFHRELARGALGPEDGAGAAEARCRQAGEALRRLVWDPVAGRIGPVRRVFLVPDAVLHLTSFEALPASAPAGENTYLAEVGPIFQTLTAERDLTASAPTATARGLLVIGAPEFGPPAEDEPAFESLPAALEEADGVAAMWSARLPDEPCSVLRGAEASEQSFKRLAPGRRAIHLATHGLAGRVAGARAGHRGFGRVVSTRERARAEDAGFAALAFAGANQAARSQDTANDGILAAEEVCGLDLTGLELAVLSACDTGAGEVQAGEGIFGLRRAFHVAGAQGLVVSLWAVEDKAAARWMEAFYRRWLGDGQPAATAARQAGLEVLARRRQAFESTHPFYWAGFVAVGR